MMNLDVSVRLIDALTKPAAEADRAIARIGETAERVATRVRSLATASLALFATYGRPVLHPTARRAPATAYAAPCPALIGGDGGT